MAHRNIRAVIEQIRRTNAPAHYEPNRGAGRTSSAHQNAHLAGMRFDGHHGAAGGFSADGAKRRCIAFSDLHAQGCAQRVFVMEGSIGKFAAAQQTMVFMSHIN
jgi:hypothetical protein